MAVALHNHTTMGSRLNRSAQQPSYLRMSLIGPSRRFAAAQQFSSFRSEADIERARLQNRMYEYAP